MDFLQGEFVMMPNMQCEPYSNIKKHAVWRSFTTLNPLFMSLLQVLPNKRLLF